MRQLKFRAWDKVFQRMVYSGEKVSGFFLYCEREEVGITLMQYTGLRTRNGDEVYEGDILGVEYDDKYPKPHRVVAFHEGAFVAKVIGNFSDAHPWPLIRAIHLNGKVIGNVYQTPSLLPEPTHDMP